MLCKSSQSAAAVAKILCILEIGNLPYNKNVKNGHILHILVFLDNGDELSIVGNEMVQLIESATGTHLGY
eukprot:c52172_g1_i1 orf=38-247(+)